MSVIRSERPRELVAPDLISELGSHDDSCLGQRKQVPIDRGTVESTTGHALRELWVADRGPDLDQMREQRHALLGDSKPTGTKKLSKVFLSRLRSSGRLRLHRLQDRSAWGFRQPDCHP
jgi:hypothetical protein